MTGSVNIEVRGLNELLAKTGFDVLVQPEIEPALETIGKRLQRQGKGLGAQKNTLTRDTQPLGARIESTLNFPRTVGTAWQQKNEAVAKAMAPRVFNNMAKRIEERWAAESHVGPGDYGGIE